MIRKSQVALGICLGLWLLLEVNIYIYIGVRSSTTSEYWEWLKRVEKHCDRPLRRDCSTVYSTIYLIGVSVKQRAIYKQTSQYRRLRRDTHSERERERETRHKWIWDCRIKVGRVGFGYGLGPIFTESLKGLVCSSSEFGFSSWTVRSASCTIHLLFVRFFFFPFKIIFFDKLAFKMLNLKIQFHI